MSLTPLDEQQRDGSETARDGASKASAFSRLRARAVAFLDRVPYLRRVVGPGGGDTADVDGEVVPARVRSSADTARVAVDGLPHRDQPFVVPARDPDDRNPVDLDAIEDEDGLTLSLGSNPEATITSDVYQDVER